MVKWFKKELKVLYGNSFGKVHQRDCLV